MASRDLLNTFPEHRTEVITTLFLQHAQKLAPQWEPQLAASLGLVLQDCMRGKHAKSCIPKVLRYLLLVVAKRDWCFDIFRGSKPANVVSH